MRTAAFDIETDGLLDTLTCVWCGVVRDMDTGEVRQYTPDTIRDLLPDLEQYDMLIAHNGIGFDFPALRKVFGWDYRGVKYDTLLISRLQRPKRQSPAGARKYGPHSLAAWGYRVGRGKPVHEEWDRYSPAMLHRCTEDVEILALTYSYLLDEGRGEGWANAHRLNFKLFENLQLQEEYGWYVDQDHMARSIRMLEHWVHRIDRAIGPRLPLVTEVGETKTEGEYGWVKKPFKRDGTPALVVERYAADGGGPGFVRNVAGPFTRISFRPVDLDKNKETKAFLLAAGWQPKEWNEDKDGNRTSPKLSKDDPFDGVQGSMGRLIARRVQCKQRHGVLVGLQEKVRPDSRIPSIVTGLATTGRAKHSVIVNIPSPASKAFFAEWMRAVFIAQPGWVLVGCDSKGNQIRQLAARMQEKEFTDAVLHGTSEEGTDLHSVNQRKTGAPSRTKAKNFFYGFIFGAQPPRIAKELGCSLDEAKRIYNNYFEAFPGLRRLVDGAVKEWRSTAKKWFNKKYNRMEYRDGWIRGLDGRPILVEKEHMILCYYLQSDEAIQMAAAYNIFHKWMNERWEYRGQWGTVGWFHDEIQFECVPEIAEEAGKLCARAIQWAGEFFKIACPHDGDYKIGRNWSETH